ncbi:hypothetical protein [Acinetobacter schindleri]|uniref:hypothetical protein n=1 Tax=Acinetobacter schindleri TaxID=108981 RepID=UPI003F54BEE0
MIKTPLSTVIGGAFWTPGATVINGAKLSFEIVMKKLFANGEQGFAYDPNDLTTMFQDSAGTIPVTGAGQPVGLMLDKSKSLAIGSDVYTSSVAGYIGENSLKEDLDSSASAKTTTWMPVQPETLYKLESLVGIADRCRIQVKNASGTISYLSEFSAGGEVKYPRYAKTNKDSVQMRVYYVASNGSGVGLVVRSLSGNHAYQTTSAARPLFKTLPNRIEYDKVDDKLITNLPAQLTGCTVVRAVPNVGTQILTGQTIPATYEDNKDHCGLIVINRALTPSETSAIAAEFNKRAGV